MVLPLPSHPCSNNLLAQGFAAYLFKNPHFGLIQFCLTCCSLLSNIHSMFISDWQSCMLAVSYLKMKAHKVGVHEPQLVVMSNPIWDWIMNRTNSRLIGMNHIIDQYGPHEGLHPVRMVEKTNHREQMLCGLKLFTELIIILPRIRRID